MRGAQGEARVRDRADVKKPVGLGAAVGEAIARVAPSLSNEEWLACEGRGAPQWTLCCARPGGTSVDTALEDW